MLPDSSTRTALSLVTDFLTRIGMPWRWAEGASGFIPGVDIRDGELLVAPTARASGLLHEAGHLAILPGDFRPLAQRDVGGVAKLMLRSIDFSLDPDGPLQRAALQCSDPEATAWAWAAGVHLDLPPEVIIMDDEYGGDGRMLRMQLKSRAYAGINGIAHAGFCAVRAGAFATMRGLKVYPELNFWLQQDFDHQGAAALRAKWHEPHPMVTVNAPLGLQSVD